MSVNMENICSSTEFTNSSTRLTDNGRKRTLKERYKYLLKRIKYIGKEITVEPCLFNYMLCIALSSLTVQNMHLEKSCRVNYQFGDEICDRIRDRNTTGLEEELNKVHSLVARVMAWRIPLQTTVPALGVLFIGAWSDKHKKRKICILFPMVGEILSNISLLLATYFFYELSLTETAVLETLPSALTGSYVVIFMGMYSFMSDRTTVENRTFRLGIVSICVNLGPPIGTILSGILLRALGYYGMFTLILVLHSVSLIYGILKLEDIKTNDDKNTNNNCETKNNCMRNLLEILRLVVKTVMVALKPRANQARMLIFSVLILYVIMVGPLFGDSQVAYLYAIRKFGFTEVEYSLYGTINIVLGLLGTTFCISVLSKMYNVHDSIVGILTAVSRIAACFVFAFAPNRIWYYLAPVFNILSYTGLTTIRSIASKAVPIEEVAKLNSLLGAVEGVASFIYSPISSSIYASTIETFPGAFYMFDAALTFGAIVIFIVIYYFTKSRTKDTNPPVEDEFATSNYLHCYL